MKCLRPLNIAKPGGHPSERQVVPCGKCYACRSSYRADWTFRLLQELKSSMSAYFITLTYNDEAGVTSVNKEHVQLFMKRLRFNHHKRTGDKLRFYLVSEYGSKTFRPHYHCILFFAHFADSSYVDALLTSSWLYGFHHVGKVSQASIHYTTKYLLKQSPIPTMCSPPFCTMSKKPGIGSLYLDQKVVDYHHQGLDKTSIILPGAVSQRLPRYYRDKLFTSKFTKSQIASKSLKFSEKLDASRKALWFKNNPNKNELDYQVHLEQLRVYYDQKLSNSLKTDKL